MDPTALPGAPGKMRQSSGASQQQNTGPRRYDGQNGNPLYNIANGGHYGELTRADVARVASALFGACSLIISSSLGASASVRRPSIPSYLVYSRLPFHTDGHLVI